VNLPELARESQGQGGVAVGASDQAAVNDGHLGRNNKGLAPVGQFDAVVELTVLGFAGSPDG